MPLFGELRKLLPLVGSDGKPFSLGHGSLSVPSSNRHELSSEGNFHKCVVGPTIDHLATLSEGIVSLIKLKELPALLAPTNIDFSICCTLQNRAKVSEGMLNLA